MKMRGCPCSWGQNVVAEEAAVRVEGHLLRGHSSPGSICVVLLRVGSLQVRWNASENVYRVSNEGSNARHLR